MFVMFDVSNSIPFFPSLSVFFVFDAWNVWGHQVRRLSVANSSSTRAELPIPMGLPWNKIP